jgi:mannosyltransferase
MTLCSETSNSADRCWLEIYLPPVLITLLATALYLYALESKSLWFDELATLTGAGWRGSWLDAIQKPLTIPATPKPPLSYVVTHLFLLLGGGEFPLRLPAALFAILTIPLTYAVGSSLFDRRVGVLGALLLAIAPMQIRYAQEARMYAMWAFFSLLSLYLFWKATRSQEARWWVLFALVTILALYTHLFALLALGVMILFALWLLVRPRTRARFPFQSRHFIVAVVAILVVYAPMIPFLAEGLVGDEGLGGEAMPNWSLGPLVLALRLFSGGNDAGSMVYILLLIVAASVLAVKDRQVLALAAMWIVLPFAIVLGLPFGHGVRLRYFLFTLPVYLLLVAYGLRVVSQWLVSRATRLGLRMNPSIVNVLVTALLLGILVAISVPPVVALYGEGKQNWRDATRLLCRKAEPGDQVFVQHVYHQAGVLYYIHQWCSDPNAWTEANVRVLPRNLTDLIPPDDNRQHWLIVPDRDRYLPGGELEASIQPHHHLLPPIFFRVSGRPEEFGITYPVTYQSLVVVPVMPSEPGSIRFWADAYALSSGDCTWLHWQVDRVREVYLDGEGVVGHDQRQVCPTVATRYELGVVRLDTTETLQTIEIQINTP